MTVQDWLDTRTTQAPAALMMGVRAALGPEAASDVKRTTEVCLCAAERTLRAIVDAGRFQREGALDLLVADALTTFAYEYASAGSGSDLGKVASEGLRRFGDIVATHG